METAPRVQLPWVKDLQKASLWAIVVFFLNFVIQIFHLDPFFVFNDTKIYLFSGLFFLFPLGIFALAFSSIVGVTKPLSDSGFWIRRAFLDLLLIGGFIAIFSLFTLLGTAGQNMVDHLSSAIAQNFVPTAEFLFFL